MKLLFILEAGIPEYRNFLFEQLAKEKNITELLVIHNGRLYNGSGDYNSKKVSFLGNNKLGIYLGLFQYIFRYDVVVSSYNLRIISCWLPVFVRKKWIFWGKGLGGNESFPVKILRKLTSFQASYILVYNAYKKQELVSKLNISEDKVIAYNNTILIHNASSLSNEKKEYFLYFGRLQERKGLNELLKEYSKYLIAKQHINVLGLRFVGNGVYSNFLKSEVEKLGLQNFVEFYDGVYEDSEIKEHFRGAKAYVSPYNVGLGIVNSFAYGVPVITCATFQVGPEFHYLNSNNSIVIGDVNSLHQALLKIQSNVSSLDGNTVFKYYQDNLSADIMYNKFLNTILTTYKNE